MPEVLAHGQQLGDQRRIAGDQASPIPGQVGPLGERVHGQQSRRRASADRGVQHRHRTGVPAELDVALVGHDDRLALPGPADHLGQVLGREHPARGVRRRVDPHHRDPCRTDRREGVGRHHRRADDVRTDRVGRVRQRRNDHGVRRTEAEQRGQPRHELLAPDRREHLGDGVETGHAQPPVEPIHRRATQRRACRARSDSRGCSTRRAARPGRAPGRGRPGSRRRGRRLRPGARGHARSLPRSCPRGSRAAGPRARSAGQCSWACGGSAATNGWSFSILPSFAAPPGEPRSSKNSTLAL